MQTFSGQCNVENLIRSGCAAQCFALFTQGDNAAEDFKKFLAFYNAQIALNPHICPVYCYSDIEKARTNGKLAAVLTVENLGFLHSEKEVDLLKTAGVKMASPVWNYTNALARPNLIMRGGLPDFCARENRGLTELGKSVIKRLNQNKIIIDISHLSDGGAEDVLAISNAPIVASHSNCQAVCNVSRNLTDSQFKKIADAGGAVGLNYCKAFVIEGVAQGELNGRAVDGDVFGWLYKHYIHMVEVGGEDLPALGSDFDGITPYAQMQNCLSVQELLSYFYSRGVTPRALEKLAFGNFARVFKEVVG